MLNDCFFHLGDILHTPELKAERTTTGFSPMAPRDLLLVSAFKTIFAR